jgi:phospholipid-binding lipoprotein MlaA
LFCTLLPACATTEQRQARFDRAASMDEAAKDPWEKTNRKIHNFNSTVDRLFIKPPTTVYQKTVPVPLRRGVTNFYDMLDEPLNLVNALMQGKVDSAFRAVDRFVINFTLGGLGIADEATRQGYDEQKHDLGQTFAVWGIRSGPFVMLPLLGPFTVRDALGFAGDLFMNPVNLGTGNLLNPTQAIIQQGVGLLDQRAEIIERGDQIRYGSADDYATVRSAWLQLRLSELYDGNPPIAEDDFFDEPVDGTPSPEAASAPEPAAEPEPS